jgi:membrane protease YdiL (CAAX protease family)
VSEAFPTPEALTDFPAVAATPSPAPSPSRARLIAAGEIVLCSGIPTQLALGGVLWLAGWAPLTSTNTGPQLSLPYVVTVSLADTLLLIVLMVLLMRAHGESATKLWIGDRPLKREVLIGILFVPVIVFCVVILLNGLRLFMPWLHNVQTNPLEQLASNGAVDAAMFALVGILAGGVREELQRAFLLHRFEQHLGGEGVGVIVTSVGFGALHYVQGWDATITTGALGFFWALVYLQRRSSVAPVISHAGFNSLEILRIALVGQ